VQKNFQITKISKNFPHHSGNLYMKIKDEILGKDYELSLVFENKDSIKTLNKIYRNKNKSTDVLSFPLTEKKGEILICPEEAKKEAKKFKRDYENFILFLFIHALCHLKGMAHGSKMEKEEKKFRLKFKV
jgi:probable rRNA maturation factor